ncbi:MAG: hypothetical protein CMD92_05020 [Gammaproteobacteria bacterium]|nr:hypothetical protein [Gammaproteobacteria bacterium]
MQNAKLLVVLMLVATAASACGSAVSHLPMLNSEPKAGALLTRAPRTLRLFFAGLPDVDRSVLRLIGPNGEYRLRGLHTMAADDLMIEILDPLTPGSYTVEWTTVITNDTTIHAGKFDFTVTK